LGFVFFSSLLSLAPSHGYLFFLLDLPQHPTLVPVFVALPPTPGEEKEPQLLPVRPFETPDLFRGFTRQKVD